MVDPTKFSVNPLRTLSPAPGAATDTPEKTETSSGDAQPAGASAQPAAATTAKLAARAIKRKSANYSTTPFWMGMGLSIGWVAVVAFVMMQSGTAHTFLGVPLSNWAVGISAIISPMAMIWMITAYLQRAADVQSVTEPLRRQLAMITGESGAAEVRIRRFNQAIKEQLDLLRSTKNLNDGELMVIMQRVNEHKQELESFEQQSLYHVNEIQDVIRRSMQHIDQLMEDKFAMLRILDNKLVQSGDDMSRQTEGMRDQITALLQDIESNALLVASTVERAMQDSKKLSDTARSQETSLLSAAETASTTLSELSGKIDTNIAHFLGRAGLAREEAERMAAALDTQTRSLDELSTMLPGRVSEAEAVLRGVADRLYASEQLAREQTNNLSAKLEAQMDGMQALLDRFAARVTEIDGGLQQRRTDLDGLVVRVSAASNDLATQLDTSIAHLGDRADGTLKLFATTSDQARKDTDAIALQLAETAARYEAATRHLGSVSEANGAQLRALSHEIGEQLSQFETLHHASQQAGQDVQLRASSALQNLQQVLERLLATRDATQSVGDNLTEKLRGAVDQNERVITRINEAARMTVHALALATESLTIKETEITDKAQTAETTLRTTISELEKQALTAEEAMRSQNSSLTIMLDEIQGRLDKTDKRLQDFADFASAPVQQVMEQIEQSTAQGRDSIGRYSHDMQGQLDRLQEFNGRVSAMGLDVSQMTQGTLKSIEEMNDRFATLRTEQEATTRQILESFNTTAARLQAEVGTLGSAATDAAATLQTAATQVGQQTYQLQNEAQDSGAKIQIVTTALQNEAAAIRTTLEKQAADINGELTRAGTQFAQLGETLKERTDSAYALLDRVAAHYNEVVRLATEEFEKKAVKLDITAGETTGKVQTLSAAMENQLSLINVGAAQIEGNASRIISGGAQTIGRLEEVNEKFTASHTTAIDGTNRVIERLEEAVEDFKAQHQGLDSAAEGSVAVIQRAGASFGEQASRMLDTTHQVEDSIRSLNAATTGFADQSAQIRSAMEQHNARLIMNLKESVEQIDVTSTRLQQTAASAILGADQANARYNTLADNASGRIEETTQSLFKAADKTDTVLGDLSAGITKQVAAMNLVSEQLAEQHHVMTTTNEMQRVQLLSLFDKLGAAHGEASSVAERTIERLNDTLQKVQTFLGQLSDGSQTALANITTASHGFSDQATTLVEHAKQAEEQARNAVTVTTALQEQAKHLRDALETETTRTGELMTTLLSRLGSASGDMSSVSGAASAALTDLQMGIARQTSTLNDSMDQIAGRQQTLTQALESQREMLSGLIMRLTTAQDETATAAERAATRLSDGADQITQSMQRMDTRANETVATIHKATEGIATEVSTLIASTEAAETNTRQLLDSAVSMQRQASDVCNTLRNETQSTGDVLGSVVDRLDTNAKTLRDVSVATETALTNLGSTINQQTTAISGNLSSITDKQSTLGAALDIQREMLGTLVTRLTLAQDETSAAAERSAARIGDSTSQITRQMETLDEQTQNALASIRSASSGLGEEALTIGQHTKQAEEQIRDMLKATGNLHGEAKEIRESMREETDKMIDQVRTVVAQLDATVGQMKQQSGSVAGVMDKSALDFSTIAKTTSETLQKQADTLASLSTQAHENIGLVNDKIAESVKLIVDASDLTEKHGLRLAETAENSTTQLVSLISTMTESDRETRTIVEKATARLTDTRTTLEKELLVIAELSQKAVEQVMGAGSALAIQSDALRANLSSSESALTGAADLVRQETLQLPNLLGRSAKEIEAAAKAFKADTGDIADAMVKSADRCISTAGAARDTMMDEAKHLSGVVETADTTLRLFNEALKLQVESIKAGTAALSDEQKELVENASATITQLTAASERLDKLRDDTQTTASKLAREFEVIEARAGATTQRLASAGDNLSKQVEMLVTMTEKAEGQMTGASQNFREQLERVRGGVQTQIDDINRGLMQITAQLDRTGTSLRAAMAGTVVDVEKIAVRFDHTSKETANQLTDRTARMRVATEEVAKLLGGFGDQIDTLLSRLGSASEGIKRYEGDLVGHMQQAFSHLGGVAERLNSTRVLADNVSEAAVSKLGEVATQVDKQMRALAEGGQTVTGIIQSVAQAYADQVGRVNSSVVSSQDQITSMTKAIDEMQQRTDRMRVTLKLQGDDLLGSLENIMHQLSGAGDAMSDAVDGSLQQKAINSLKKIS